LGKLQGPGGCCSGEILYFYRGSEGGDGKGGSFCKRQDSAVTPSFMSWISLLFKKG